MNSFLPFCPFFNGITKKKATNAQRRINPYLMCAGDNWCAVLPAKGNLLTTFNALPLLLEQTETKTTNTRRIGYTPCADVHKIFFYLLLILLLPRVIDDVNGDK